MSPTTRRLLLILVGVVLCGASVTAFMVTASRLDDRIQVVVAASHIDAGQTVDASHLTSARAVLGDIPHVEWSSSAVESFAGLLAARPIAAGSPITADDMLFPDEGPTGGQLEVIVPLDTALAPDGVVEGDEILLVAPATEATDDSPARPRRVLRSFQVVNFDGESMRIFAEPAEYQAWRNDLADAGGRFEAIPLTVGQDAEQLAVELNAVWFEEFQQRAPVIVETAAPVDPAPGPGQLEAVIELDLRYAPSGIASGDTVLIVDPGAEPTPDSEGRPPAVLQSLTIEHLEGNALTLFLPPDAWAWWLGLPSRLGAAPQALPVPEGTDIEQMSRDLDAVWAAAWGDRVSAVFQGSFGADAGSDSGFGFTVQDPEE
ncbi:SAF domain-containing protein [Candidatus Poriferisodalis sp.]|uniref:SAF domain-containing protein n=1 Tax=Candidatus Poriferisodalis sp. TaxID=3101277 RepID=UPI003B01708A